MVRLETDTSAYLWNGLAEATEEFLYTKGKNVFVKFFNYSPCYYSTQSSFFFFFKLIQWLWKIRFSTNELFLFRTSYLLGQCRGKPVQLLLQQANHSCDFRVTASSEWVGTSSSTVSQLRYQTKLALVVLGTFPAKGIHWELNWELSLNKSYWIAIKRGLLWIPSAYKATTDLRGFFVCQEM